MPSLVEIRPSGAGEDDFHKIFMKFRFVTIISPWIKVGSSFHFNVLESDVM